MTVAPGSQLGPYTIVSALGAGGMGEVFRARDTRLDRFVAIKILSVEFTGDPEAEERLRTEAQAISALNHPNICTLLDVGREGLIDFLVMELLEGETLGERLTRGPLPLDSLWSTAQEIAAGLDAAHAKGITHRDLKPSNVMLTRTGAKLLDFGLAKQKTRTSRTSADTQSHNLSTTVEGAVLGTLPYMAPEQIEALDVDARTDLFAFGALLFEMATGRRAFDGRTHASLAAAILEREPPLPSHHRAGLPRAFDHLVVRCLAKNPDDRWQSAHDLMLQLKWIAAVASEAPQERTPRQFARVALALALMAVLAAGAAGIVLGRRSPVSLAPGQFEVSLPAGTILQSVGSGTNLAVSPDGRFLVAAVLRNGQTELWLRPFDASAPRRIPGTEGARLPFWSPDSKFVGFTAGRRIQRVDLAGGMPQTICEAKVDYGLSWGQDGTILFSDVTGIYRVASSGGVPAKLTSVDRSRNEREHLWPGFLPDGRHFLFLASIADQDGVAIRHHVYLGAVDGTAARPLIAAESRMMFANGYMLYVQAGTLQAHRFDLSTLGFVGDPKPLAERVWYFKANGMAEFSASETGVVAFHGGTSDTELLWFDRAGRQIGRLGSRAAFLGPRVSPDGGKVAVAVDDWRTGAPDVWIYDRDTGIPNRLTADPRLADSPVWSADGSVLYFRSALDGSPDLFTRRADGSGGKDRLLEFDGVEIPYDVSRDGRQLLFADANRQSHNDLWTLSLPGPSPPRVYLRTPYDETDARFSPDGRWVAFMSNETQSPEIYVAPIDDPGAKQRVSIAGGTGPRWRSDGRELVYLTPDSTLMSVPIDLGQRLHAGVPRPLFSPGPVFAERSGGIGNPSYDMSADGSAFLVNRVVKDASVSPISVILNWPGLVEPREP